MMRILVVLGFFGTIIQNNYAAFPNLEAEPFSHRPLRDLGSPLILTTYLERNRIQEARTAAKVNFEDFLNVTSFSGYFTVDKARNSNIFFWFFPSADNYNRDPVLLWLNGGPGSSSLFGLFAEHGPFVTVNGTPGLRDISWHRNHSVLYVDQPIGTGFSYTDGPFLNTESQLADHMYTFLTQFFTLFSELRGNEFYISGESYAGKYVYSIANAIDTRNPAASLKINLQGILIGNGFSDPINSMQYGDYLYAYGLVDKRGRDSFYEMQNASVAAIRKGQNDAATAIWISIVSELFYKYTEMNNVYNLQKFNDDSPFDYTDYVVRDEVRQALHVGNQTYHNSNRGVFHALFTDITTSVAPLVSKMLSKYHVLIYSGQLDYILPYPLTRNYLQKLNFSAAAEYKKARRKIWTVRGKVAGYVKTAGNLTEVLVRNCGHIVPFEQPEFAYDLVYKFVRKQPIVAI